MYTFNSSCVKAVAYNETEATLIVAFSNNRTYEYYQVPRSVWRAIQAVVKANESIGSFINKNVVRAGYAYNPSNWKF